MSRTYLSFGLLAVALAVSGCNEGRNDPIAATPVTPSAYHLPPGAPCSAEIETYRSVVAHDLETGNVEQKVADKIQLELSRASAACSAGRSGEAHAIVSTSKAQHGYRA